MTAISSRVAGTWIDGAEVATVGRVHAVVNPATDEAVAEVATAEPGDVDAAVAAARAALPGWAGATPADRSGVLGRLAEASAWTRDVYRAQRASRDIKAGCVWINDHIPIISEMPHGGVGASGFGKDMSDYSLEEYLTIKHVMSDITGVTEKPWHRTVFKNRG